MKIQHVFSFLNHQRLTALVKENQDPFIFLHFNVCIIRMGTRKQNGVKTITSENSKISHKDLKCPLCDEKLIMGKLGRSNSIQFHLFSHYIDKLDDWENRLEKLKKEMTHYECDICSKIFKGGSEAVAKKSIISHLALQHHELRPILEKDSRLDTGM